MLWGFIALAIVVAIVLAGRAHSRYLDRQDQLYLCDLSRPQIRPSFEAPQRLSGAHQGTQSMPAAASRSSITS